MATRPGILALLAFFILSAAAGMAATTNICMLLSEHDGPSTVSTAAAMFAGTEDPSFDQPGFSPPIKEPYDSAAPVPGMGARVSRPTTGTIRYTAAVSADEGNKKKGLWRRLRIIFGSLGGKFSTAARQPQVTNAEESAHSGDPTPNITGFDLAPGVSAAETFHFTIQGPGALGYSVARRTEPSSAVSALQRLHKPVACAALQGVHDWHEGGAQNFTFGDMVKGESADAGRVRELIVATGPVTYAANDVQLAYPLRADGIKDFTEPRAFIYPIIKPRVSIVVAKKMGEGAAVPVREVVKAYFVPSSRRVVFELEFWFHWFHGIILASSVLASSALFTRKRHKWTMPYFFGLLTFLAAVYSMSLVMALIAQQPSLSPGSALSGSMALVVRRTAVIVATASALIAAIASDVTIELGADIYLTQTIFINGQTNLKIDGKGFKVDGGGPNGCFNIQGSSTEVEIENLTVTNSYSVSGTGQ